MHRSCTTVSERRKEKKKENISTGGVHAVQPPDTSESLQPGGLVDLKEGILSGERRKSIVNLTTVEEG